MHSICLVKKYIYSPWLSQLFASQNYRRLPIQPEQQSSEDCSRSFGFRSFFSSDEVPTHVLYTVFTFLPQSERFRTWRNFIFTTKNETPRISFKMECTHTHCTLYALPSSWIWNRLTKICLTIICQYIFICTSLVTSLGLALVFWNKNKSKHFIFRAIS